MYTLSLHSSLSLPSSFNKSLPIHQLSLCHGNHHLSLSLPRPFVTHHTPLIARRTNIGVTTQSNEGVVEMVNFDDLNEKDWSFLESDCTNSPEEHERKINRIISAGEIGKTSRILASLGSEEFVDRLVEKSNFEHLTVVHESLFVLAGIKEKYDEVKCWQGELIEEPESWSPLDVVFLYFLPGLPFKLEEVFEALSKCCLAGARLVISHPEGREVVEKQKCEYPTVVLSELPEKMALHKVATQHSFELSEYVDEPGFYLALLKFCKVE